MSKQIQNINNTLWQLSLVWILYSAICAIVHFSYIDTDGRYMSVLCGCMHEKRWRANAIPSIMRDHILFNVRVFKSMKYYTYIQLGTQHVMLTLFMLS